MPIPVHAAEKEQAFLKQPSLQNLKEMYESNLEGYVEVLKKAKGDQVLRCQGQIEIIEKYLELVNKCLQ